MTRLRLGTRGSALALWQARTVAARLTARGAQVEIVTISTRGDRRQCGLVRHGRYPHLVHIGVTVDGARYTPPRSAPALKNRK